MPTLAVTLTNMISLPGFSVLVLLIGLLFPIFGTSRLRGARKLPIIWGSLVLSGIVVASAWLLQGVLGGVEADLLLYGLLFVSLVVMLFATCIVANSGAVENYAFAAKDTENPLQNQIISEIPVGVWRLGADGSTLSINHEMSRLLELDHPEDVAGHSYHSFFTPDALSTMRFDHFTVTESLPRIGEGEIVSRSGRKRLAQVRSFPEFSPNGAQVGLLLLVSDISETRALEIENRKLSTLPKFSPFPVMSFTSSGHLIYFNEAARELARSLGSEGDLAILPLDMQEIIKNCIASGQTTLQHEINLRGRTISWSFVPIKEAQVVHCYALEITQRLTTENQLRQAQRMESVGQLAGGIAHDLNNLLNVIMGYAGLLQIRLPGRTEEIGQLRKITEATERAADLTQNLLTFSRKQVMQAKTLDLNEVLNSQNKLIQGILGTTVSLQCTYAPNLPPVQIDPAMLEQIITNLAANAKDAMHEGGQLVITTRLIELDANSLSNHPEGRVGRFVSLSVADTGIGIEPDLLSRIFEPFFTTKGGGKERGLGLAEVRSAVRQHRGWIEVSSQLRQGATFRIYLPATPQEWIESSAESLPVAPPTLEGGGERILIVEDEPALLALASNVLESYGYEIVTAESAEEAFEKWKALDGKIDLVLTDVVMPNGMSGSDLARRFRKQNPKIKILYTSGFNKESILTDETIEEGHNFLPKPYLSAALARTVRARLDQ